MNEFFTDFQKDIEDALDSKKKFDKPETVSEFLFRLEQLQKERLLHLMVTIAVCLSGLITCLVTLFVPSVWMLVLDILLMGLGFAYIIHYRKLENTTQYWYKLYLRIKKSAI